LPAGRSARAWRIRVPNETIVFQDRACGRIAQNLARDAGDFILLRADGLWAYQLAVVVDDADAGVTDVVRGADLLDSTPRQIFLQRGLGLTTPDYMHLPVALNDKGEKLSKQTGARPIAASEAESLLRLAFEFLGLAGADKLTLKTGAEAWRRRYLPIGS